MAVVSIEQVQNSKKGERFYYVAVDELNEFGGKTSGVAVSPYYSKEQEARAWKKQFSQVTGTYCVLIESLV